MTQFPTETNLNVVDLLDREGAGIEHVRASVDHGLVPFQRVFALPEACHARDGSELAEEVCQVLTIWVLCNRPARVCRAP
jgi:hypothetical protein